MGLNRSAEETAFREFDWSACLFGVFNLLIEFFMSVAWLSVEYEGKLGSFRVDSGSCEFHHFFLPDFLLIGLMLARFRFDCFMIGFS
jgi:hypothetical protein